MSRKPPIPHDADRRLFLKQAATLGGLSLATGGLITHPAAIERMLNTMNRWNDTAQAWLFDPTKMAPTYDPSMITEPFPFNAFYGIEDVPIVKETDYKLELTGKIADKTPWKLADLRALPQTSQITRHICVEGWSAVGKWGGVPFADFLKLIGADTTAKYVGFTCADGYHTSIDMPTALHAQTLLTLTFADQILPAKYGFPMKLRIPTKLGYKNPKHITSMTVTNVYPGGYWEDQGYNWFGGS